MRRLSTGILISAMLLGIAFQTNAQSIINPNDPVLEYDPANPPPIPDGLHPLIKWVRTLYIQDSAVQKRNRGWNSDTYKAYNYQGQAFRVRFPKSYDPTANDGKKYPLLLFLHGQGENSRTYLGPPPTTYNPGGHPNIDNQWQLLQGPPEFDAAIQNGTYDGYVLVPQLQNDTLSKPKDFFQGTLQAYVNIIKYMIANNKVDPFHIVVDGLSEGGVGVWRMLDLFPTYMSAGIAISAPTAYVSWNNVGSYFQKKRYTPIWTSQGGLDNHPTPAETQRVVDTMNKYGANFRLLYYPNLKHSTWYQVWADPGFWPMVNNAYASNPWAQFGKDNFWPGEPINTTIGITPGFDDYEWRRNGQLIVGSNTNELHVTGTGVYDARVKRDGIWSDWSHVPVTITGDNYRIEAEDWVNMSGAQTEVTQDVDGNLNVGWLANGDWLDYTISPYVAGFYQLQLRMAGFGNAKVEIRGSDSTVLGTVDVPATGGWQNWVTVPIDISLLSGTQNLRLKVVSSSSNNVVNINWLTFYSAGVQSPLPVKFLYFNAHCNGSEVNLQWKTAQEQNSAEFSVERSTNGGSWNEIGRIAAAGQSAEERNYTFVDKMPVSSSDFYRIVEHDLTGLASMSSIIKSSCSSRNAVSLYPNPSSGNSSLSISLEQTQRVALYVLDSKGALMQERQMLLPSGTSIIPLEMSSYSKGVYSIRVNYSNEIKTIKMIKK